MNAQKKKRRLRLDLITSRLSRPYATPSTHIVSRGASKIAIWARQKAFERTSLRKAAIMNRIRIKREAVREAERKRLELGRRLYLYSTPDLIDHDIVTDGYRPPKPSPTQKPHRQYTPLCPSPLGLSDYDALDQEGDPYSEDEHEDADVSSIYSDFNVLDSNEPVLDNYDSPASFDDPILEYEDTGQQRPPTPPREEIIELVMEREKQQEVSFVDFGP